MAGFGSRAYAGRRPRRRCWPLALILAGLTRPSARAFQDDEPRPGAGGRKNRAVHRRPPNRRRNQNKRSSSPPRKTRSPRTTIPATISKKLGDLKKQQKFPRLSEMAVPTVRAVEPAARRLAGARLIKQGQPGGAGRQAGLSAARHVAKNGRRARSACANVRDRRRLKNARSSMRKRPTCKNS